MDLEKWREKKTMGEKFITASGLEITLRKVSLMALVEAGGIPTPLVNVVNTLLNESTKLTVDNLKAYLDAVNLVVKATVIDPPVTDEPGDGVLGVRELSPDERLQIYTWATAEVGLLIPFRPGPEKPEDPGQPGTALSATPGDAAGDHRRVAGVSDGPGGGTGGQQQDG